MIKKYDAVVIGAGSAGLTSAVGLSKVGKKVLLIEREHMGGECTNSGCIPSKALLHHAKTYSAAIKTAGKSPQSESYRASALSFVRGAIDEILAEETEAHFESLGITVIKGEARFVRPCAVAVHGVEYEYKKAIIATGSSPRPLSVPGLSADTVLTNQNIFTLTEIPQRLLVIGSGPIGLELGQAFAMLGSDVTIASIDSELGRLEDPAIRPLLTTSCTDLGITLELNAHISSVEHDQAMFDRRIDGVVTESFIVQYDKILVAIGRVPNLPAGLDAANIAHETYGIVTDRHYRTSNKYVYAIGDVAQRLKFTHTADDTARQVVARIASRGWLRINTKKATPKVTYTEPEIAQVGSSWVEAVDAYGIDRLHRIEVPLHSVDRARTDDVTKGVLVVIARRLTGTILGAHYIGPRAGEIITPFTLAIDNKLSLWKLRRTIYAYPTYSLIIKKAGDMFFHMQVASVRTDIFVFVKRHTPKLIAGIFWIGLIYTFQHYRISNDLSYQDILFVFYDFFTMSLYGPLLYILLYAIRPLIFFPATLLTALSGALFGFWWGVLYTVLGENASANLAYWLGRFFGKDLRLEDTLIGNWVEALRERAFSAVLFMRLFYVPFDLTNYGAGVVGAKWREYFLATLIGIMPGLTTFVALGAAVDIASFKENGISFDAFDPRFLALSISIFIASVALSHFLKRWRAT